jgi:hypothetical protein
MGTSVAEAPVDTTLETEAAPTETLLGAPPEIPAETAPAETTTETAAPDAPAEVVYDLKLPENSFLAESVIERMTANARESGLSPEAAQKQLEFLNNEVADANVAFLESLKPGGAEWQRNVAEWTTQVRKDPELGGTPEKFTATIETAKRVLSEVFPPSVAKFLHESGYGSHPDVIRGLAKIAKMTSEGTFIQGHPDAPAPEKSLKDHLYTHPDNFKFTEQETTQ